jgi:periplasmic divalent cation tolerance protein
MVFEKLIVFCTAKDYEEAHSIAHALVKESLASCVNIVPGLTSIFRWKGHLEEEKEFLLIIKTSRELYDTLVVWMKEMHSYEVPELIAFKPASINPDFSAWWDEQLVEPSDLGA